MESENTENGCENTITARSELATEILSGLTEGFHYATLAYNSDGTPIEVAWNYPSKPERLSRNDDFTDREATERRRKLAEKHQEQFDNGCSLDRNWYVWHVDGFGIEESDRRAAEAERAGENVTIISECE
jgi:hypothetical protein